MKFDYSNRYKFNKNNKEKEVEETKKEEVVEEPIEEKEAVVEEPIEETVEETKKEEVVEETVEEVPEDKEIIRYGSLMNCELLNGRKEPDSNSDILLIINKDDVIKILEELDEFYKVLVNNKEVYCMKKFIEIK